MSGCEAFGVSRRGHPDDHNEDFILTDARDGVFLVADGIGGRPAGDKASAAAARAFVAALKKSRTSGTEIREGLRRAVDAAHRAVRRVEEETAKNAGAGTTLSALVLDGGGAFIVHIGDSRVYLFRAGRLRQLTSDHTLAAELVKREHIRPGALETHPLSAVLSRAVNGKDTNKADYRSVKLKEGDIFLLATDGFYRAVDRAALKTVILEHSEGTVRDLAAGLCREADGKLTDDMSVAVVRIGGDPQAGHSHGRRVDQAI